MTLNCDLQVVTFMKRRVPKLSATRVHEVLTGNNEVLPKYNILLSIIFLIFKSYVNLQLGKN